MAKILIKFKARIATDTSGKRGVDINDKPRYNENLKQFKEGEEVWITIDNKKAQRSNAQNKWYWVCVELLSDFSGHTPKEIHEFLKLEFLPKKIIKIGKTQKEVAGSTTKLTTSQMIEYMMRVQAFASSEGLELPVPQDRDISIMIKD